MKKEALILSAAILLAQTKAFAQIDLLGVDEENQTVSEEQIVDISEKETQISQDNNTEEQIENQMTEENVIKADNKVQSSPVDDYFAGFIEDVEAEKKAKREAGKMLNERPKIIKLRKSQLKELEKNKLEREKLRQKFIAREQEKMKPEEKVQNIMESYENAPLGLYWAITPEKMQQIGFELEQIEREDYPNSYIVKNYESRGTGGYENVIVSFGENNELWCINAQTSAQKDDPTAKETLKLYNKYFEALSEKYGNPNEHFMPNTYEEEIVEGEGENAVTRIIKQENPRGNQDFLKELQTGKAELYATFHNNNIGVTLSVYIDENGLGQLVLDYKNLPLMKKEKEAFINNL